jgi:hypothetical protein
MIQEENYLALNFHGCYWKLGQCVRKGKAIPVTEEPG